MQNGGNIENNSHINPLILNMFNPQQQAMMINQFNQVWVNNLFSISDIRLF